MRKIHLVLIGFAVILLLIALVFVLFGAKQPAPEEVPNDPFGGIGQGGGSELKTIQDADGRNVTVPDFTENKTPLEGAGGNYYDLVHGDEPIFGNEGDWFHMQYGDAGSEFIVALKREPLSYARTEAEKHLKSVLGLSEEELCRLNVNVGVSINLNEVYGRYDNLGLSFCPNAVTLP